MPKIVAEPLPETASLARYRDQGAYTDCFACNVSGTMLLEHFIAAFYTTPLFKLERLVLKFVVAKPSSDADAKALAQGTATRFAAWTVEARDEQQILLCDYLRYSRSWLSVAPVSDGPSPATRLRFGSAIVPVGQRKDGRPVFDAGFHALKGLHVIYARALLQAAASRLRKS